MAKPHIFRKTSDKVAAGILFLLFGYFFFFFEARELSDSYQYLHQFVSREPVYALVLKVLTRIFGEGYKIPLSLLQNLLAVACIYWLYYRLTELFSFSLLGKGATVLALLSPHLFTPLMSRTRMVITNSVLTEGISFSLYYLWLGLVLTILVRRNWEKRNRSLVLSLGLSLLLSLIRGQLMICIIVWCIAAAYVLLCEKNYRGILLVFLGFVFAFTAKTQMTKIYHLVESGVYINTVSGNPMMLSNALYLSEIEDGAAIEDVNLRAAYETMVTQVKEQGLAVENASGNIIERAKFHENGHETINFDIIVPVLNSYIKEKDSIDESQYRMLLVKQDQYAGEIFKAVLPEILPEYLQNYFVITALGFVRSIAVEISFLPLLSVFLYLGAVGMAVYLLVQNRTSPAAHFMLLVLLCIAGTVFGTSLMIECISRYMIYNLPFFYIAGYIMVRECLGKRKTRE